ncbi:MAG: hypothetical protein GXY20_03335 [Clostridiales bacterium]|nr:hypothetical protein [Clostridiales bacterium]
MDIGKLKNIVIILLVIVNLCFAGILAADILQSRGIEARENSELAEVLASNGIFIDSEIIPKPEKVQSWTLTRNQASEAELAKALLGETNGIAQGGGIWLYQSPAGWIRFRSGGEFEAELNGFSGTAEDIAGIFAQSGASLIKTAPLGDTQDGSAAGEYVYTFGGAQVVNCKVTISTSENILRLSGMRLYGQPQIHSGQTGIKPQTAIMSFLNRIKTSGGICNRIDSLEIGYMLSVFPSGASLEPVWCIRTDAGTYYVSAVDARTLSSV